MIISMDTLRSLGQSNGWATRETSYRGEPRLILTKNLDTDCPRTLVGRFTRRDNGALIGASLNHEPIGEIPSHMADQFTREDVTRMREAMPAAVLAIAGS